MSAELDFRLLGLLKGEEESRTQAQQVCGLLWLLCVSWGSGFREMCFLGGCEVLVGTQAKVKLMVSQLHVC